MSIRRFEEAFMKGLVAAVWFGLLAAPAFAQQAPPAPGIQNAPEIPFESVPFLKLTPERNLGEVLGVAVNSKGHVVVLNHPGSAGAGPGRAEITLMRTPATSATRTISGSIATRISMLLTAAIGAFKCSTPTATSRNSSS